MIKAETVPGSQLHPWFLPLVEVWVRPGRWDSGGDYTVIQNHLKYREIQYPTEKQSSLSNWPWISLDTEMSAGKRKAKKKSLWPAGPDRTGNQCSFWDTRLLPVGDTADMGGWGAIGGWSWARPKENSSLSLWFSPEDMETWRPGRMCITPQWQPQAWHPDGLSQTVYLLLCLFACLFFFLTWCYSQTFKGSS